MPPTCFFFTFAYDVHHVLGAKSCYIPEHPTHYAGKYTIGAIKCSAELVTIGTAVDITRWEDHLRHDVRSQREV
jgi:hypothetical protein